MRQPGRARREERQAVQRGPIHQLQPAVMVLDECGAAFDPVAVVDVQHAVHLAHLGVVDVAADHAVEAAATGLAGKRLLVMHGDEFDSVVRYARFLAVLGDWAYTVALAFNRYFNAIRRRLGYPYWSLSAWLKRQVKEAVKAIDRFEAALAGEARRRGFDGVVCGHIHHAEMREVNGVLYLNDGDWVESCTALVEHHDGRDRKSVV